MLNINLTFDYELFFGENFSSSEDILFSPTDKILDLLDKYDIKATFFADVLSVFKHLEYGLNNYAERFTEQIKNMIKRGHDVQLHIHSNWLKSTYSNGKWNFDVDSYRIHSFGFDEKNIESVQSIIRKGKEYLENTLNQIDSNYKCIVYRAGGYSIQPHNELFKVLLDNKILVDSSIALGQKANHINIYDYANMKRNKEWFVSPTKDLSVPQTSQKNNILEIPVGFSKNNLFIKLLHYKNESNLPHETPKGSYISDGTKLIVNKENLLKRLIEFNKTGAILSLDSLKYQRIIRTLKSIKTRNDNGFLAVICHPKLCDRNVLNNMESFIQCILKEKSEFAFTTMTDSFKQKINEN